MEPNNLYGPYSLYENPDSLYGPLTVSRAVSMEHWQSLRSADSLYGGLAVSMAGGGGGGSAGSLYGALAVSMERWQSLWNSLCNPDSR